VLDRLLDLVKRIEIAAERRVGGDSGVETRLTAVLGVLQDEHLGGAAAETDRAGSGDRLDALAQIFGLEDVDVDLLLIAAAPDLDANVALGFGLLRGVDGPARASVGLAMELCGLPTLSADGFAHLGSGAPLCAHALLAVTGSVPWLSRELEVPDRVLAHLVGCDTVEPDLGWALVPVLPLAVSGSHQLARGIAAGVPLTWVRAPEGTAGLSLAASAFTAVGLTFLAVDTRRVGADSLADLVRSSAREAALRGRGLIVASAERLCEPDQEHCLGVLAATPVPVVLVGTRAWDPGWLPRYPLVVDAPVLGPVDRDTAWKAVTGSADGADALSGLRLTPERIVQTAGYAETLSAARELPVSADLVQQAARVVGGSHTAGRRPSVGFGDLVLPDYVTGSLQRLVGWVQHRDDLPSVGGLFDSERRGRGIAALFTGNPGTGKTLAAHVIAGELGLDLVEIDLSAVVDKYIGETEKHLEKVFHEAESLNVVLLFDEADALFGRRSEVKDAHDRYANQEVAYLLQRMERFDGITILATNLRGNIDHALTRRMQFIVHFPDPDVSTRERLWQLYLGRLETLDPQDPVDVEHLAAALEVSGGEIHNIVVAAVYDATAEEESVGMRHVLAAAVGEYQKLGRRIPAGGFEPGQH
jgi:predicted nucleic acid-binding protein